MTCKILSLLWTPLVFILEILETLQPHFLNIRITQNSRLIHNETRAEWNRSGIDYIVNRLPITPRPTSIIRDSMQRKAIMGVSECGKYSRQHCSASFENDCTVARVSNKAYTKSSILAALSRKTVDWPETRVYIAEENLSWASPGSGSIHDSIVDVDLRSKEIYYLWRYFHCRTFSTKVSVWSYHAGCPI